MVHTESHVLSVAAYHWCPVPPMPYVLIAAACQQWQQARLLQHAPHAATTKLLVLLQATYPHAAGVSWHCTVVVTASCCCCTRHQLHPFLRPHDCPWAAASRAEVLVNAPSPAGAMSCLALSRPAAGQDCLAVATHSCWPAAVHVALQWTAAGQGCNHPHHLPWATPGCCSSPAANAPLVTGTGHCCPGSMRLQHAVAVRRGCCAAAALQVVVLAGQGRRQLQCRVWALAACCGDHAVHTAPLVA